MESDRLPGSGFRLRGALALVLGAIWWQAAVGQDEKQPRPIVIDDLFAVKGVGSPRVSPDGQWVAYTVTETDLKKERSETSIWMIPAAGGEPIRMTAKGASAGSPRWSPDGKHLSFQSSRGEEESSQVWLLNRMGGEAQQLTEVRQGVDGYEWSPDSGRLVLEITDPRPEELIEDEEARRKAKEKRKPWVIDRLQFKRDYAGYLDRRRSHLYVFDLTEKKLTQVTSGDFDDSQPAWSPDGKLLAFVSNRTSNPDGNENSDVWVVSADNNDKGQTLLRITTNPGSDASPAWSPDGEWIAYVSTTEPEILWYAMSHIAVSPSAGGQARALTASLDRNVSQPAFSSNGLIYFLLEDDAEQHLASIPSIGGEVSRVVSGPRAVLGFDLGRDGAIAFLDARTQAPEEIFVRKGSEERQLTEVNKQWLSEVRLGQVENVEYPSADGTRIEGFLVKPSDFNPRFKYPTLLRIHGGPVAQYDHSFDFEAQLFAANGYLVVLVNPRGSSGYGRDFAMGIYQSWGEKDYEDVMAGVDYAIRQGYADPERLGVGGWSYGGILTNYVITKTDRFKAAISGASEVLYVSNYGHDHYQYEWEAELGLPWENRELWEKLSPFNSVEQIVTPTLILCGEKDWNVPVLNSEQLYQALKRLGRTTELVVYPGEHHGIRHPSFQKDRLERYLAWYGQHVKGEEAEPKVGN